MILLEQMSHSLGLPRRYLIGWASKASHAYFTYTIPKASGGVRTIHHPAKELKGLQRWLQRHVISRWPLHDSATAYRKGKSIRDNAEHHSQSRFLLKLDLEDFFPSITSTDVRRYLMKGPPGTESWTNSDRELFCEFTCRYGELTIGAPSSPGLSNALAYDLDVLLHAIAEQYNLTYTRYADDLFFSTRDRDVLQNVPALVENVLRDLAVPANLRLNHSKTRHLSKRHRRLVTGLVIGSRGEVSIGRARKRYIRRQVHRLPDLTLEERVELRGLLAYARGVEPDFINALILKYGAARVAEAQSYS